METWKIGELAKRTGLTVRTLHHYDEIGLLQPSARTPSGHRLYSEADVRRLQRILLLRQLGFALDAIGELLDGRGPSLDELIAGQLERIRRRIALETALCERLESVRAALRSNGRVPVETLMATMEMMMRVEDYYTPEQLEQLKRRGEEVGEERMRAVQQEWTELFAAVRAEMEKGTDPSSERVQALARKWKSLIEEFTGGDPGIAASLSRMYTENPGHGQSYGLDPALMEYVGKAWSR